jgi:hypothetical protein
MVCSLLNVA